MDLARYSGWAAGFSHFIVCCGSNCVGVSVTRCLRGRDAVAAAVLDRFYGRWLACWRAVAAFVAVRQLQTIV